MKKLLFILLLLLAAYLLWRWWRSDVTVAHGEKVFYDRLWVDHLPTGETDTIRVVAAITEQPVGIHQSASAWRGDYEIFRYEPRGDGKLLALYPQTREREEVRYEAAPCQVREFDFCLELKGSSRGVKKYYSQRGWEIGSLSAATSLSHRLAGEN